MIEQGDEVDQIGLDTKGPIQGLGLCAHNPPRQEAAVTSPPPRYDRPRRPSLPHSGLVQSDFAPVILS